MSLFRLFLIFVKIGAILLGGGYVILPIMLSEFTEKRDLVSKDDIINYYALAQSLPGIVAANISMFVGYKLRGVFGAVVAMIGIIFVPFWSIILLASILSVFINNNYVHGLLWGVGVAVTALIMLTVREMWQNAKIDLFFYLIFIISLMLLLLFKLSPVCVIISMTVLGVLIKAYVRRFSK